MCAMQIRRVCFGSYAPEDIRKLSIAQLYNPVAFDDLGHPNPGGLYDPRMGPLNPKETCVTCTLRGQHCPGHIGHIDLPLPVYNPMFLDKAFNLLKSFCRYKGCHKLKVTVSRRQQLLLQLKMLQHGLIVEAKNFESALSDLEHIELDEDGTSGDSDDALVAALNDMYNEVLRRNGIDPEAPEEPIMRSNSTQINAYRSQLIADFLARCSSQKICPMCQGISRGLTKEDRTKIFKASLKPKQAARMKHLKKSENAVLDGLTETSRAAREEAEFAEHALEDEPDDPDDDLALSDDDDDDSEHPFTTTAGESSGAESEPELAGTKPKPKPKTKKYTGGSDKREYMSPLETRRHMELFWSAEKDIIEYLHAFLVSGAETNGKLVKRSSPSLFFLECLPVPANRFRPASQMGDKVFENPQTVGYNNILKACMTLQDRRAADSSNHDLYIERLNDAWQEVQFQVSCLIDSGYNTKDPTPQPGIRQSLEKKEGLMRKHFMGKRVNYAARSVVSPDPMLGSHEIGIPEVFACKLTYPEPVTKWNFAKLRAAVINGPNVHPGATHIVNESGNMTVLSEDKESRTALANQLLTPQGKQHPTESMPKKVLRHIHEGDFVLMNRQPTLHKASIMAHQVRVLPAERTIRLHYANCKSYNADFDGDEMNVHFPQNELARAEAASICNTDSQYISLQAAPLRGLIQDFIVSGVKMTKKDSFYTKEIYQQLVYSALRESPKLGRILLLPPAMIKPQQLWTGKQIITTILKNLTKKFVGLNLTSKTQIKGYWVDGSNGLPGERDVIVRDGELLSGLLDKSQIGAKSFGLVHSCQEVYGGQVAGELLSALGRLFTQCLKYDAISLGVDDLLLTDAADEERTKLVDSAIETGRQAAAKYVKHDNPSEVETVREKLEPVLRDDKESQGFDRTMMSAANGVQSAIITATVPKHLRKPFPKNCLQMIIQSGAKGSPVNATQISCLLGQQALEGRRVPVMISGKTLPSFPPFDPSLRAGGMVLQRFLTGLRPQEYFFHCMAGREGLIDTAVKTSRSGYLQRCLVKHLEDLRVHYDMTVRNADGAVVQFRYGDDSLDVTKTAQLENYTFMAENYVALLDKYGAKCIDDVFVKKYATRGRKYLKQGLKNPSKYDPAIARLQPDRYFGAVSEAFATSLETYLGKDPDNVLKPNTYSDKPQLTADKMRKIMYLKSLKALTEPGEAIGVQAAQALGEPSTQMTLNTFHFAGRSESNVTLGIPRLREVIMTGSENIKTPAMKLPILPGDAAFKKAKKLESRLRKVALGDVLQGATVHQRLGEPEKGERYRYYTISLQFVDVQRIQKEFGSSFSRVLKAVEYRLIKQLLKMCKRKNMHGIKKLVQEINEMKDVAEEQTEGGLTTALSDNDIDSDDNMDTNQEDAGTLASKAHAARAQEGLYDEDESEGDGSGDEAAGFSAAEASAAEAASENKGKGKAKRDADDEGEHEEAAGAEEAIAAMVGDEAEETGTRIQEVLGLYSQLTEYDFDESASTCKFTLCFPSSTQRIVFVTFIEEVAAKIVVREVQDIESSSLAESENAKDPHMLYVDGDNMVEIWKYADIIDLNNIDCNNIKKVAKVYGIEAARMTAIQQLEDVFGVYGITVNHRHLSLIADYMTFEGEYKGMSRMSMRSNTNPFLKMSFETTIEFLRAAVLNGDVDELVSNSSQLVVGKGTANGTGGLSCLQPIIEERQPDDSV